MRVQHFLARSPSITFFLLSRTFFFLSRTFFTICPICENVFKILLIFRALESLRYPNIHQPGTFPDNLSSTSTTITEGCRVSQSRSSYSAILMIDCTIMDQLGYCNYVTNDFCHGDKESRSQKSTVLSRGKLCVFYR